MARGELGARRIFRVSTLLSETDAWLLANAGEMKFGAVSRLDHLLPDESILAVVPQVARDTAGDLIASTFFFAFRNRDRFVAHEL